MKAWNVNGTLITAEQFYGGTFSEADVIEEGRFLTNAELDMLLMEMVEITRDRIGKDFWEHELGKAGNK